MGTVNEAGLRQIMERTVAPRVRSKTRAVFADLVRETPVDTGRMRQGWRMEFHDEPSRYVYTGVITNRTRYLPFVVWGHGWIYPRRARALHWVGRGGDVFAAKVRPVPGRHFVARVLRMHSRNGWRFVRYR